MTDDLAFLLDLARDTAERAGDLVRERQPARDADDEPCDALQAAIEQQVRRHLKDATAHLPLALRGEIAEQQSWVLDPLDGAANFRRGLPLCAVGLTLVRDGRAVLGVVALPLLARTYRAADGLGAWRDRLRLSPARRRGLSGAVIALDAGPRGGRTPVLSRDVAALHRVLAAHTAQVRILGCAALDLVGVAEGTLEARVSMAEGEEHRAGTVIAREAGAVTARVQFDAEHSAAVTTSPAVSAAVIGLVARARYEARAASSRPAGGWSRPARW